MSPENRELLTSPCPVRPASVRSTDVIKPPLVKTQESRVYGRDDDQYSDSTLRPHLRIRRPNHSFSSTGSAQTHTQNHCPIMLPAGVTTEPSLASSSSSSCSMLRISLVIPYSTIPYVYVYVCGLEGPIYLSIYLSREFSI